MQPEQTVSEMLEEVLDRQAKGGVLREEQPVEMALETYMERLNGKKNRSQYHALLEELASLRG